MDYARLAEFPADMELSTISRVLDDNRIAHYFQREGEANVLYVDSQVPVSEIAELVRSAVLRSNPAYFAGRQGDLVGVIKSVPVTTLLLVLSIIGALLTEYAFGLVHWFTFQDFARVGEDRIALATLDQALSQGQYWRLITPIFLHFGVFHIVFNGLWLWELGRRIESLAGGGHLLAVVAVAGLGSNFSQYLWSGPSLFGGMSGVIYGLLGYVWIRHKIAPDSRLYLQPGIIVLMMIWLVVCMLGIIDYFFAGSVANAAHASGLAIGAFLGALFGFASRRKS